MPRHLVKQDFVYLGPAAKHLGICPGAELSEVRVNEALGGPPFVCRLILQLVQPQ